jgi:hypothetical protein
VCSEAGGGRCSKAADELGEDAPGAHAKPGRPSATVARLGGSGDEKPRERAARRYEFV